MNMFLTLLTLIVVFLFDCTLGKAIDSQRKNTDFVQKDSRGMQRAKEMLRSDQANFYTNPLKSATSDGFAFEWSSVPIPNDDPASTIEQLSVPNDGPSSTIQQLSVPNNSPVHFKQLSVPMTAPQAFSAMTATMTATMTQVPATKTATTNTPRNQLDNDKATRTQHKTRSPSILHSTKKAANYATQRNLLLYFVQNNPAITISGLLLPHDLNAQQLRQQRLPISHFSWLSSYYPQEPNKSLQPIPSFIWLLCSFKGLQLPKSLLISFQFQRENIKSQNSIKRSKWNSVKQSIKASKRNSIKQSKWNSVEWSKPNSIQGSI